MDNADKSELKPISWILCLCNRIYIILGVKIVLELNYVKTAFNQVRVQRDNCGNKKSVKEEENARLATVIPKDERLIKTSLNI